MVVLFLFYGTNRHSQLSCKAFTPSGIIRHLSLLCALIGRVPHLQEICGSMILIAIGIVPPRLNDAVGQGIKFYDYRNANLL